jgi:hypothetical protein
MVAGNDPAGGASDAAFWGGSEDGWGLVRGTVRLPSGEPVGDCGVVYYALTAPADAIHDILIRTDSRGVYHYPLPVGTYTMAANGSVTRVSAAGVTTDVPVIGKVTGLTVASRQVVTGDITVMERPDLIGETADLGDLLGVVDYLRREQ